MLAPATLSQLADYPTPRETKLLLAELSVGLTMARASAAPKLYQLREALGESMLLKLLTLVLRAFVDAVHVPAKPDGAELIELADHLAETYPYDSLKDVMLALKEARLGGTVFYNKLDQGDIGRVVSGYFERKARWREQQHLDRKAHGTAAAHHAVAQLGQVAPQLVQHLSLRMDPAHPNAALLRRRLSLTAHQERRGLLTPEQAAARRAEVARALVRQERRDWPRLFEAAEGPAGGS